MRNVFDQYNQPENKVTHALVTALNEDRKLLAAFLDEIVGVASPVKASRLRVCEQSFPGQPQMLEEEAIRNGIPDAWITDGDCWCVLIENKVLGDSSADQLTRHREAAKRMGFDEPNILLLTIKPAAPEIAPLAKVVEWRSIYRWLLNLADDHVWAKRVSDYIEVIEGHLIIEEQLRSGTMTAFNGVPFGEDNPYSYLEAKRLLGLAMAELRTRKDLMTETGINPRSSGRPAITGRDADVVWDFLQTKDADDAGNFTSAPHLTLGIHRTRLSAMVTIPHALRRPALRRLVDLGRNGFLDLVHVVLNNMKPIMHDCPGMEPRFHAIQRRYRTQRSVPFEDAVISFDLRTCFDDEGPPKTQPQWLDAVYDCLARKKSNFQTQIGAWFPYRTCEGMRKPEGLDYVARTWIACNPLLEVVRTDYHS